MIGKLLRRAATALFLFIVPCSLFACFSFDAVGVTKTDDCTTVVSWTFEECQVAGIYYIIASTDGGITWYLVNSVPTATPNGNDTRSYTYTDDYAHPNSGAVSLEYRVIYVPNNGGASVTSSVTSISIEAHSGCPSACSGLSSASITGPQEICNGNTGTFSMSNSYSVIWNVLRGGSLVTLGTLNPTASETVKNNSSDGQSITLEVNILGCQVDTLFVPLGVPPDMTYSIEPSENPLCDNSINSMSIDLISPATYPGVLNFDWEYTDVTQSIGPVVVNSDGGMEQDYSSVITSPDYYDIYATAENSCGSYQGSAVLLGMQASDCGGLSTTRQQVAGAGALFGQDNSRLSVYPNPTQGLLTIQLPDSFDVAHTYIRVVDVTGRSLQTKIAGSFAPSVNMAGLGRGIYFVEIFDGKRSLVKKIIRQ